MLVSLDICLFRTESHENLPIEYYETRFIDIRGYQQQVIAKPVLQHCSQDTAVLQAIKTLIRWPTMVEGLASTPWDTRSAWPDAGIKNRSNVSKSCPKRRSNNFDITLFFKISQRSSHIIWATFVRKLVAKRYQNSPIWSHCHAWPLTIGTLTLWPSLFIQKHTRDNTPLSLSLSLSLFHFRYFNQCDQIID